MPQHGITAEEAFAALAAGSERGLDFFFNRYYSPLLFYAQSLIHNAGAAQEIASDAFVKLWHYRTTITDAGKIKFLLYRIVYNASIDYIREQKTRQKHSERFAHQSEPPSENTAFQKLAEAETYHQLYRLLQHLPPRARQIFNLFYFHDKGHKEIAREMGISVNTVKTQKQRALQTLKELLGFIGLFIHYALFFI